MVRRTSPSRRSEQGVKSPERGRSRRHSSRDRRDSRDRGRGSRGSRTPPAGAAARASPSLPRTRIHVKRRVGGSSGTQEHPPPLERWQKRFGVSVAGTPDRQTKTESEDEKTDQDVKDESEDNKNESASELHDSDATAMSAGPRRRNRTSRSRSRSRSRGRANKKEAESHVRSRNPLCIECGKELRPDQVPYKKTTSHNSCGNAAFAALRAIKQVNPKLHKELVKMKKTGGDIRLYREIMGDVLNDRKKRQRITEEEISNIIRKYDKAIHREKKASALEGVSWCDEEQFQGFMFRERHWDKDKSKRVFRKESQLREQGKSTWAWRKRKRDGAWTIQCFEVERNEKADALKIASTHHSRGDQDEDDQALAELAGSGSHGKKALGWLSADDHQPNLARARDGTRALAIENGTVSGDDASGDDGNSEVEENSDDEAGRRGRSRQSLRQSTVRSSHQPTPRGRNSSDGGKHGAAQLYILH